METLAVVFDQPREICLRDVGLQRPSEGEAVVRMEYSGISTGTERLLWDGRMPDFPGMGYPLVPGYEGVGTVDKAPSGGRLKKGDRVFVPGSSAFEGARGLFGADANRVVVPVDRLVPVGDALDGSLGALLALAATAFHAVRKDGLPELIIGHGVLGRLMARMALALGGSPPRVWEISEKRLAGAEGYTVLHPENDDRKDYVRVCDVSGDAGIIDRVMPHLAVHGQVSLAGFYSEPVHFDFPPAFQREAKITISAEFTPEDVASVVMMAERDRIDLNGLITHTCDASDVGAAFVQAFEDHECLKMVLDWRHTA